MQLFDGKYHASLLDQKISRHIQSSQQPIKELAIIQIGEDASSKKYVNLKKAFCDKIGVPCEVYDFAHALTDAEISEQVKKICDSEGVGGVIIQIPLPRSSLFDVLDDIPVEKDLDVLSSKSKLLFANNRSQHLPPVVRAVKYFIKAVKINDISEIIIVGNGFLVGKPLYTYFTNLHLNAKVIDEGELQQLLPLKSELAILATGTPNLINGENIDSGTNVIDFGSSVVNGKIVGDLNMTSKLEHLATISTSPRGMGPLVVRFLIMNHLKI